MSVASTISASQMPSRALERAFRLAERLRQPPAVSSGRPPLQMLGACATVLLAALLAATAVSAQSNAGTTVGQFLLIEPSGRLSAMGNAGVTADGEVLAAYYNPAALGVLRASDVQFTHAPWLAGITYDHAALALVLPRLGTVLATVTSLNSGDIEVRTVEQPLGTGELYRVHNLAVGLGYGRAITDRFAAGLQVSYVREAIWNSALDAFGVNFGMRYQLTDGGAILGASISNLGTRGRFDGIDLAIRYDPDPDASGTNSALPGVARTDPYALPVLFRVGVALPVRVALDQRLTLVLDAHQPSDNTESVSVGAEWSYRELLLLRTGYQNLFQSELQGGITAGGGVRYAAAGVRLRFDYSWNAFGRLGNAQRFTLGVGF
jgi:hypothetical protein